MCEAVAEVLDMTVDGYDNQGCFDRPYGRAAGRSRGYDEGASQEPPHRASGRNECTMQTGIHFLDIVHDLEKISDHCSNIAIYTIQLAEGAAEFDTHAYVKQAMRRPAVRGEAQILSG